MMIFSPSLDELALVEDVVLARLREGGASDPLRGLVLSILEDVWQGEDPMPSLAWLDSLASRRQGRKRLVPEEVGWLLVSLHALLTLPWGERSRRVILKTWIRRNQAGITPTVPAQEELGDGAGDWNRRLVAEVRQARAEARRAALGSLLREAAGVPPANARPPLVLLETVGLLTLPPQAAEDLGVDACIPQVTLRVLRRQ